MRQGFVVLLAIIFSILEATLLNFSNFRFPLVLLLILFFVYRNKNFEFFNVAIIGGLVLDLLSYYWFGLHLIFFLIICIIASKTALRDLLSPKFRFAWVLYIAIIFIFMEIFKYDNLFADIFNLLIGLLISGLILVIFLHSNILKNNEYI